MKNRRVETGVGTLFVREEGAGTPVVFWHSLFVDGRMFDAQVAALASNYRCVRIDGPGHGASENPPDRFDLASCAEAAMTVFRELDIDTPHWVGCAFGGHVGVTLAAAHRTALRTLAVFNAPMQPLRGVERWRIVALVQAFRFFGPVQFITDAAVEALLHPEHRDRHGDYVREAIRTPPRRALLGAMRGVMLGRRSLVEDLGSVSVPTLFVTSDHDAMWTPEVARRQVRALERGAVEVIEGTCHLTPLEAPTEANALLKRWFVDPADSRPAV